MATKFDKVTLSNIEQGDFLTDAENALQEVCTGLIEHFRQYAKDGAAKLTLDVNVSQKNGMFVITTDITKKLPKKPSGVTTAMPELDVDGTPCLFCQSGGTHAGNPKQSVLCKDNGEDLT